ncbi:MAG: MBL fold metallo-hydrolase [Pseudomonadales bacterium]|nr:MBL fold metallo-hydrolase [Pseudomonadales bacterium]
MIFRQLFDLTSSTYTYLLACERTREAVIIDTVFPQFDRDAALVRELGLDLKYVLDTHVHADHVTAAWRFHERFGAKIVLSGAYGAKNVDIEAQDGDVIAFGDETITVHATPGHTAGCLTFVTGDGKRAFTGDCLLVRGAGRTDFQSGDVGAMWHSIHDVIFTLPPDCLLYPGHDYNGRTVSSVAEEKRFNPRIGGDARLEDFSGYMNNLGLPHPKLIAEAVPANMRCGRPEGEVQETDDWAPLNRTFAGVSEIDPEWLATHIDDVYVLDVRSAQEFLGEPGHLRDAHLLPLDELRARIEEVPRDVPVVTVCQSGKRSAMAAQILAADGRERVANLPGGIIDWFRMALPLTREGSN